MIVKESNDRKHIEEPTSPRNGRSRDTKRITNVKIERDGRVVLCVMRKNGSVGEFSAYKTLEEFCELGMKTGLTLPKSVGHAPWVFRGPLLRRFLLLVAKERGPDVVVEFVCGTGASSSLLLSPRGSDPFVFSRQTLSPQELQALTLGGQ